MIHTLLTNDIIKYITEIEKSRDQAKAISLSRARENQLCQRSLERRIYASNRMAGNPLTQDEVSEVLACSEPETLSQSQREIFNYGRAVRFLNTKAKAYEPFSKQLILKTYRKLTEGLDPKQYGLRKAAKEREGFALYDPVSKTANYVPPKASQLNDLLEELVNYVQTSSDHPLIMAAIVHYQLITIYPFYDGNGRMARLISNYLLQLNDFSFAGLGVLEDYFEEDLGAYREALEMGLPSDYASGRDNPPHPELWLHYYLKQMMYYADGVCEIRRSFGKDKPGK